MRPHSFLLAAAIAAVAGAAHAEFAFDRVLKEFGHRNWILVADSAYPAQTGGGVEVVYLGGDHAKVVRRVLRAIDDAPHVRPKVYLDAELSVLDDTDAPGVTAFRQQLRRLMADRVSATTKPHGELIQAIAAASEEFRVLVLKTDATVPYSTVFINLECGYWSDEQEARLRAKVGD